MANHTNSEQRTTPESELHLLERELEETKTVLSTLFDFSPFPMWISDSEGTCLQINKALRTNWGVADQDVVGKYNIFNDPVPKEQGLMPIIESAYNPGQRVTINIKYTPEQFKLLTGADRKTVCVVESTLSPIKNASGHVQYVIIQHNDLTAQKLIEEEKNKAYDKLKQAQKLEAIGLLAAGVAHEINQPLTFVKGILECTLHDLKEEKLDQSVFARDCQEAVHQANRISRIVRQLRVFGRAEEMNIVETTLDKILDDTLILIRKPLESESINLKHNISNDLPIIQCDHNQLVQVFVNLFQNAIAALKPVDKREIVITIETQADTIEIHFVDNGTGIPLQLKDNIFDPFVSTKETAEGSGLGLSIAYGIIKKHQGDIQYIAQHQGCCFVITLPLQQ